MGIFNNIFGKKPQQIKAQTLSFDDFNEALFLRTPDEALKNNLVWSAVKLISDAIGSLPLTLFKNTDKGRVVVDNALGRALKLKVNSFQTADALKAHLMVSLLLRGNAFLYKVKDQYGNIVGFTPLNPDNVEVELRGFNKVFLVGKSTFTENEIIHIIGLSVDGISGISALEFQSDPITLNNTIRKFSKKYFKNGAHLSGYIKTTGEGTQTAIDQLKVNWANNFSSVENVGKTPVLPKGFDFEPLTVNAKDALLIEALNSSVLDISRIFNIPPHLLGDLTKSSYSSIEAQGIEFMQFTLLPWIRKIESAINSNLFPDSSYFVEFNVNAFARGTLQERYEAHKTAIMAGFMTQNEARAKENLPPVEGGDTLWKPLNYTSSNQPQITAPKEPKARVGRPPKQKVLLTSQEVNQDA